MCRTIRPFTLIAACLMTIAGGGCAPPDDRTPIPPPGEHPVPDPAGPGAGVPAEDLRAVADGNNAFAIDLYKRLAEKSDGNIVVSPYSISSALAMTYAGARGETAAEMAKVLHFTLPPDRLHPAQAALGRSLRAGGDEFHAANALWGQKGVRFRGEFLRVTRDNYGAGLREVDFAADPDAARRTINGWVAAQTRDKIRALLHADDLSARTRLVLTNAVYFKGAWASPFSKGGTAPDTFRVAADRTVPVRMMNGHFTCRWFERDGVRLVALPYRGRTRSMVLVVPAAADGLPAVERGLSADRLRAWLDGGSAGEVRLALPVFRATARTRLSSALDGMGMPLAFRREADFTGVTDETRLHIDEVVHEAAVEVGEEGTEAAAATAVVTKRPLSGKKPRVLAVRADRPFLFLILDDPSQAVLFLGRVASP